MCSFVKETILISVWERYFCNELCAKPKILFAPVFVQTTSFLLGYLCKERITKAVCMANLDLRMTFSEYVCIHFLFSQLN